MRLPSARPDEHPDTHTHRYSDSDTYEHSDEHPDTHTHRYSDSDTYDYSDEHADCHAHEHPYEHSDGNPDGDRNLYADPGTYRPARDPDAVARDAGLARDGPCRDRSAAPAALVLVEKLSVGSTLLDRGLLAANDEIGSGKDGEQEVC
jgi:hypothetical protein